VDEMGVNEVFYRTRIFKNLVLRNETAEFLEKQEELFKNRGQWLYWRLVKGEKEQKDRIKISLRVYPGAIEAEAGCTIVKEIEKQYNLGICYLDPEGSWGCELNLYCNSVFSGLEKALETLTEAGDRLCESIQKYTGQETEKILKRAGLEAFKAKRSG